MSRKSGIDTSTGKPFQNVGYENWCKLRADWRRPSPNYKHSARGEVKNRNLDIDAVIEHVFSQPLSGQLPHPVPLGQMIDILIDFWEADGLYD
jgi:hypothetical protein